MIRASKHLPSKKTDLEAPSRDSEENDNYCYKVITQDRHDEIVEVQASLMVGIAKEVCN